MPGKLYFLASCSLNANATARGTAALAVLLFSPINLCSAAGAPVGTGKIAKERGTKGVTVARFPISIAVISDCKMA